MPKILELASPVIILCAIDSAVAARRHLRAEVRRTNNSRFDRWRIRPGYRGDREADLRVVRKECAYFYF